MNNRTERLIFSLLVRRLVLTVTLATSVWLVVASSMAHGATESISYVGATILTSTLEVEGGPVPAGPYLANATFPSGSNAAADGVLIGAYCGNAIWSGSTDFASTCSGGGATGTGTKTCSGASNACQSGPNDDDYCYATTLGAWNCGVPGTAPEPGYTSAGAGEAYASQWAGGSSCTDSATLSNTVAQSGAAVSIDNNDPFVLAPFNPCDIVSGLTPSGSSPSLKLGVGSTADPIPASSYEIVLLVTNPSSSQTSGCFSVSADSVATDSEGSQLQARTAALVEWSVTNAPTSSTLVATEAAIAGTCSTPANVQVSGFFILNPGSPTGVSYANLRESVANGFTTLRWRSTRRVAGFNLYEKDRRLNARLVISRTSRYILVVRRVVAHPTIVAVPAVGG